MCLSIVSRLLTVVLLLNIFLVSTAAAQTVSIKSKHEVKIDKEAPAPALMYSDILKSMQDQVCWNSGQIRMFEQVRFVFLPPFKDPHHIAGYNPSTGARLTNQVLDAKGNVVTTMFWEARKQKHPFWQGHGLKGTTMPSLSSGKYVYRWAIEGQTIWELPITVTKEAATDAYSKPKYYFDGPWEDCAYIYVPNGNPQTSPAFSIFLRDKKSKPGAWVRNSIEVEIKRDGKTVCQHPGVGKSEFMMRPWWQRYDLGLRTEGPNVFHSAELLKTGDYEVDVRVGGKPYAKFSYSAKDGKLPMSGRQNRKTTKGIELMEGGQDRFYLKRIK